MVTKRKLVIAVSSLIVAVFLAANLVHQVAAKENPISDTYASLKTFTDVLGLVQKNYVEEVKIGSLVEGAVKGMLLTLDPHSSYLAPDMYKDLKVETKGEFGGLGIEITIKNSLLTVVAAIEGTPAERSGLKTGDQIIKIGDDFTRDMTLVDAVKMMRGPKGSPITLSIHREGKAGLLPITVIRDIIKVKSVYYRMLDEGFGWIRLAQFQENSSKEFLDALRDLGKKVPGKKLHGLVIDLRNNPGGLLTEAIRVADLFLKEGVIVYTDGRLESQKQKYFAHDDGEEPEYPLVVLINGGSASASEIVSGALQDDGRALILGTQSFGKGSVQTILPMDDGAALRLTTALYYTKSGRSIQAQGITPDIKVSAKRFPGDFEEVLEGGEEVETKEKDLPGAFKNPTSKSKEQKEELEKAPPPEGEKGSEHKKESPQKQKDNQVSQEEPPTMSSREAMGAPLDKVLKEDPQLEQALRLLKSWRVFKKAPLVEAREASLPSS